MEVCTIGFSHKDLREFIKRLKNAGVEKVIDIRLHNTSQLAGYAKMQDLEYILELVGIDYEHVLELAPTEELMKDYKGRKIIWEEFQDTYNGLLAERKPLNSFDLHRQPNVICLLCAEDKPDKCHRNPAAQYIKANHGSEEVVIKHL